MGDKPPLFWEDVMLNRYLGMQGFLSIIIVSYGYAAPVYVENPGFEEPDIDCWK